MYMKYLYITQLILICSTAVNFAMEKDLQNFKQNLEQNTCYDCPFEVIHAYKDIYETTQQSIEQGLMCPTIPHRFIRNAHATMVFKKKHADIYNTCIKHNIPLAQGNIIVNHFKTSVTSIFHPIVLSTFSIPFQQYLIETRNTLLKLKNINDLNTLSEEEKNMFTVDLFNLSYQQLKKECNTNLTKIIPYYEILKRLKEKNDAIHTRMRIPETIS